MRTILIIIRKEFIQIFRNTIMLRMLIILPVIQLVVLVNAVTFEMKRITMVVVDNDLSYTSRLLNDKFRSSGFFKVRASEFSLPAAETYLANGYADMILVIPTGFEKDLERDAGQKNGNLQVVVNAINNMKAGLIHNYTQNILNNFAAGIIAGKTTGTSVSMKKTDITYSYWYNPRLNYKIIMLPGILVVLVTIVGMFMTALNLVREKETGTAEQINVTPVKKYQLMTGKLVPFMIIALFELSIGLLVGFLFFNLPFHGNLIVLFLFAFTYLLAALGLGLLLSTMADTQQQVMFLAFFFLILFIMMSGLFTPVESMPLWAQRANIINPFAVFVKVIRMILIKGSGINDIAPYFAHMSVYAIIMISLAVWRYRKTA
mgnify:CR=1 FL=1